MIEGGGMGFSEICYRAEPWRLDVFKAAFRADIAVPCCWCLYNGPLSLPKPSHYWSPPQACSEGSGGRDTVVLQAGVNMPVGYVAVSGSWPRTALHTLPLCSEASGDLSKDRFWCLDLGGSRGQFLTGSLVILTILVHCEWQALRTSACGPSSPDRLALGQDSRVCLLL